GGGGHPRWPSVRWRGAGRVGSGVAGGGARAARGGARRPAPGRRRRSVRPHWWSSAARASPAAARRSLDPPNAALSRPIPTRDVSRVGLLVSARARRRLRGARRSGRRVDARERIVVQLHVGPLLEGIEVGLHLVLECLVAE